MSQGTPTESRAVTSLGVDIGTRMTKVIGLSTKGDHLEIQAAINFKLPSDLIANGVVQEPKAFGKILERQLLPTGCRFQETVFSIPTNLAVLRWINLPNLPPDELRQAARYKVKRHLPFPVEEAYVEATPPAIEDSEETGTSLVIAVPQGDRRKSCSGDALRRLDADSCGARSTGNSRASSSGASIR